MGSNPCQCLTAFSYYTKFTASCHTVVLGKVQNFYSKDAADRLGQLRHKKNLNLLRLKQLCSETHSKAILGTVTCSLISTAHSGMKELLTVDANSEQLHPQCRLEVWTVRESQLPCSSPSFIDYGRHSTGCSRVYKVYRLSRHDNNRQPV